MNARKQPVAVVIGATSKWQKDGRNTRLIHGDNVDDMALPAASRWGVGGAIAQKFAAEGFFTVLTTRNADNAADLEAAIAAQGRCRGGGGSGGRSGMSRLGGRTPLADAAAAPEAPRRR